MTDNDREFAARRAVLAALQSPGPFVPHCGYCGKPLPCACGTTPAKDAPTMPPPAEEYIVERYGVKYCTRCNFPAVACRGHGPTWLDQG